MTDFTNYVTAKPLPPHTWHDFPLGVRVAIRRGAPNFQHISDECPIERMRECFHIAGISIVAWSGVLDVDSDEPSPINPKTTSDLMHIPGMKEALMEVVGVEKFL